MGCCDWGAGLTALVELIQKLHIPNFAKWRWGTLTDVCNKLAVVFETLKQHWDPAPFRKSRDQTMLNKVCKAFGSDSFAHQFKFVRWYASWLGGMLEWIGGCDCHDPKSKVECWFKGRRLRTAFTWATAKLQEGLATASEWTVATFGEGITFLHEVQGCVRYVVSVTRTKLDFLDRVPLLCARLDLPGVRDRCVRQWLSSRNHSLVTADFMDPSKDLRKYVDMIRDDGSGIQAPLRTEMKSLWDMPMNDAAAEGPRNIANVISQRSRHSSWPFVAASMRLQQNLQDVQDLIPATDSDLEGQWDAFKNILKKPGRHALRPMRMKPKQFEQAVYHLGMLKPGKIAQAPPGDEECADDDLGAIEPALPAAPIPMPCPQDDASQPSVEELLIREFLSASLEVYCCYSFPVVDGDHPYQSRTSYKTHV